MTKIAVLSSHNGSGFEALYNAMQNNKIDIDIKLVISNNRDAPVLEKAKSKNIANYVVNSATNENPDEKIASLIKEAECKYVFLSGYMKKLSPSITSAFRVVNSHPSLLPKFGGKGMYGTRVHEAVISNHEKRSGVTLHEVNENYDEGRIILQKELLISEDETVASLETKIKQLESIAIVEGMKLYLEQD